MRLTPLILVALSLAACKKGPPEICNAGTSWADGQVAFQDATASWGLDVISPTGTRISAVDFDGDGWADLAIRSPSQGADDFKDGGARTTWLLRNNQKGGFEDVTQSSGIVQTRQGDDPDVGRPSQVWAFGDIDNDGDLDAFTGTSDSAEDLDETSELLINQGDGTFSLGDDSSDTRYARWDYEWDTVAGASFVDFDRDGNLDLWTPQNAYTELDELYQGDGNGGFTTVTEDAGLITFDWDTSTEEGLAQLNGGLAHSWAWSALACDVTNDGWPELMVSSYGRAPNILWQNAGDGTFTNRGVASGYAYDENQDWTDNGSAQCWCHLHPEDDECEGVPEPQWTCNSDDDAFRWSHETDREAWRLGGNSGTTVCGDVDNDGWNDLLTTEIVHWDVGANSDPSELLFNTGSADATFERPGNLITGLTRDHISGWNDGDMTGALFDFDNDGWKDVFIGSSDYEGARALLWHNDGDRTFTAVPVDQGIDHTRSHGIGVADFDHDGDLDVVLGHSSARCESDCYDTFNVRLFENVTGEDAGKKTNFLQVDLVGTQANRSAIGARVEVTTPAGTQVQEVGGGHGHYGMQHDLVLTFGLGSACEADVKVLWPDAGRTEEVFTLGGGYRWTVKQGEEPQAQVEDEG